MFGKEWNHWNYKNPPAHLTGNKLNLLDSPFEDLHTIRPVQSTAFLILLEFLSSFFLSFFQYTNTWLYGGFSATYELGNYVTRTGQRQQLLANVTYIVYFTFTFNKGPPRLSKDKLFQV